LNLSIDAGWFTRDVKEVVPRMGARPKGKGIENLKRHPKIEFYIIIPEESFTTMTTYHLSELSTVSSSSFD